MTKTILLFLCQINKLFFWSNDKNNPLCFYVNVHVYTNWKMSYKHSHKIREFYKKKNQILRIIHGYTNWKISYKHSHKIRKFYKKISNFMNYSWSFSKLLFLFFFTIFIQAIIFIIFLLSSIKIISELCLNYKFLTPPN